MRAKTLNSLIAIVLAIIGLYWPYPVHAISMHKQDFTLTVSSDYELYSTESKFNITVTEKNISSHIVNNGRNMDPAYWYTFTVLLNGSPAPFTKVYRVITDPSNPIPFNPLLASLKPNKKADFIVPIWEFVDFSTPGKYEIKVSRGTDGSEADSVIVESNILVITVQP